jgi:hypothetical protein
MDVNYRIAQLTNNANSIRSLAQGVSADQARWKPDEKSWSILEVINHLYDEEREDFRLHLDWLLYHNTDPWHSIDPQGWVTQRKYNERDLQESLANFSREREQSLAWLKGLPNPNWQIEVDAPFGKFRAGDLFSAWVAHDLLHLRQLVELRWAYTVQAVTPYQVRYAGEW